MMTTRKTPIALIAILALSAACSSSIGSLPGISGSAADVHAAMPGHKDSFKALGLDQPPVSVPADPVMQPASVTFASARTNVAGADVYAMNIANEYMLPPVIPGQAQAVAAAKPEMVPTQYREVIFRSPATQDRTVYASTLGNLLVE